MSKIRAINVSTQYKLDMHNVNASDDSTPKNVNGRAYISGQKIRYMLMETIKHEGNFKEFISTSDGVICDISKDLRSDFMGYMKTAVNNYANRRTSPVKVSFSISKTESNFFDDFFVRFKSNPHSCDEQTKQRSLNKTYSESDIFNINYEFDCYMLSTSEYFRFDKDKNVFIESFCIKHVEEKERKRRAELLVKGTSYLTGLANQSRNAVVNIPEKVFICFDNKATFKKFFDLNDTEQSSLLKNLDSRDIPYFLGGTGYETSVSEAYYKACEKLNTMDLEDITSEVLTQEEVEEKYKDDLSDMTTKAKEKVKTKKTDSDSESEL